MERNKSRNIIGTKQIMRNIVGYDFKRQQSVNVNPGNQSTKAILKEYLLKHTPWHHRAKQAGFKERELFPCVRWKRSSYSTETDYENVIPKKFYLENRHGRTMSQSDLESLRRIFKWFLTHDERYNRSEIRYNYDNNHMDNDSIGDRRMRNAVGSEDIFLQNSRNTTNRAEKGFFYCNDHVTSPLENYDSPAIESQNGTTYFEMFKNPEIMNTYLYSKSKIQSDDNKGNKDVDLNDGPEKHGEGPLFGSRTAFERIHYRSADKEARFFNNEKYGKNVNKKNSDEDATDRYTRHKRFHFSQNVDRQMNLHAEDECIKTQRDELQANLGVFTPIVLTTKYGTKSSDNPNVNSEDSNICPATIDRVIRIESSQGFGPKTTKPFTPYLIEAAYFKEPDASSDENEDGDSGMNVLVQNNRAVSTRPSLTPNNNGGVLVNGAGVDVSENSVSNGAEGNSVGIFSPNIFTNNIGSSNGAYVIANANGPLVPSTPSAASLQVPQSNSGVGPHAQLFVRDNNSNMKGDIAGASCPRGNNKCEKQCDGSEKVCDSNPPKKYDQCENKDCQHNNDKDCPDAYMFAFRKSPDCSQISFPSLCWTRDKCINIYNCNTLNQIKFHTNEDKLANLWPLISNP